uniref:Uncharacterized protein n=1 Tax=Tanacetum cinerariifolium TaxID=118510 RepID=A0A6L2LZD6_TANCI|nr:hypothetical protein [Tanacetum cinerariifolium]
MSSSPSPTHIESITSTDATRGSSVFTPSPFDPYMLVRQAYSPTALDTESEPLEASLKIADPQPLSLTSAPPSPDYTPVTPYTNDESKPFKTFETRVTSPHFTTSPADSTSPPSSPRPPLTQTPPTLTPPQAFYYHSTA